MTIEPFKTPDNWIKKVLLYLTPDGDTLKGMRFYYEIDSAAGHAELIGVVTPNQKSFEISKDE